MAGIKTRAYRGITEYGKSAVADWLQSTVEVTELYSKSTGERSDAEREVIHNKWKEVDDKEYTLQRLVSEGKHILAEWA